jgi:ribosomal protein L32
MIFQSLQTLAQGIRQQAALHSLFWLRPQFVGPASALPYQDVTSALQDFLWFAVPKQKVTRHKKRLKTTLQKRIKLKSNIIVDPRTGEVTLKHKLPFNWKDYLPKID